MYQENLHLQEEADNWECNADNWKGQVPGWTFPSTLNCTFLSLSPLPRHALLLSPFHLSSRTLKNFHHSIMILLIKQNCQVKVPKSRQVADKNKILVRVILNHLRINTYFCPLHQPEIHLKIWKLVSNEPIYEIRYDSRNWKSTTTNPLTTLQKLIEALHQIWIFSK